MGGRGTRSAREVAAIVLLDDNFRTIVRAIAEGRQLFRNLQLSFAYLLMIHIPLVITAAFVPLAGFPLLYLPIHIVWLELIIHPTAMLVFQERPSDDRLAPASHTRNVRFFMGAEWGLIAGIGLSVTAAVFGAYWYGFGNAGVEHARAAALACLTLASAGLTAGLSRLRTATARTVCLATAASSFVLIQWPTAARLLHLSPLHVDDWGVAAAVGLLCAVPWTAWSFARGARREAPISPAPSVAS
jgi:Ca2+-transporting ATPase